MRIINSFLATLAKLNFFVDAKTLREGNEQVLHDQVLSTRIYLVLLTAIICTLVFFTAFNKTVITVKVSSPSLATYEQLQARYPTTLSCSCSQVAVPYADFISIKATFHPVRNSETVIDSRERMSYSLLDQPKQWGFGKMFFVQFLVFLSFSYRSVRTQNHPYYTREQLSTPNSNNWQLRNPITETYPGIRCLS